MLTNLKIKSGYSSNEVNLSEEFYNPCLSEAISYDRVAGYFSSSSLKYLSKGIENLLKNKGKYRLIISNEISEFDYTQIKTGYKNKKELIKDFESSTDFSKMYSNYDKQQLANLAYLIEIGLVEIKIGFYHSGIFHAKFGLIHDEADNIVYFSGSANETENALQNNYENIDIKKSWTNTSENDYLTTRSEYFDDLWDGRKNDSLLFVSEVNEFVKFKITSQSRGRIIIDKEVFEPNSIILIYQDNQIKLINNLDDTNNIGDSRHLKKLKNKYLFNSDEWIFNDNLPYTDIQEIIELFEKHSKRKKINFVIGDSVHEFIDASIFEIEEVAKRGLLIKNQDDSLKKDVDNFDSIVRRELTNNFSLREIQKWVSYYMTQMKRIANFSVPGSGKTAMVYGAYAYLSSPEINKVNKLIVIGPKNSFISWKDEFKTMFKGKRKLNVIDIHAKDFNESIFSRGTDGYELILINYEAIPKYAKHLRRILNSKTIIVFDEVHKIKNPNSIKAPLAIELANKAKYRFVLTGTPIPNKYTDIWNFLHILYNEEYKKYFNLSLNELENTDMVTQENINKKLNPFFWRVTKNDLKVPKANEDELEIIEASDLEQEVLNLLWKKYRSNPLKLYTRLIQFSSNPSLLTRSINKKMFMDEYSNSDNENKDEDLLFEYVEGMQDNVDDFYSNDELALINSLTTTGKFESCISKIDQLVTEGKTVLVWCIFVDTIDKVVKRVSKLGHRVKYISGHIDAAQRELIVKEFQEGLFDVLVTNPHTLAESVSLHKACHDAIYLEYSFNLTHMLQSRDRIHRLGLKENQYTSYYYFMLSGQLGHGDTIDKKIYYRLKEKEETMLDAIEGEFLKPSFSTDEKEEIINFMRE